MKLIRHPDTLLSDWTPFDQLASLRDDFNRLFELGFGPVFREARMLGGWAPALDVHEEKDALVVVAELPGMKKEEIDISLHKGLLTISGERKEEASEGEGRFHRNERFYGKFSRTISLPVDVDANAVTATYKDGLLTVRLPKSEEAKPKQITVGEN